MKKIVLASSLLIAAIVGIAIYTAFKTGQPSVVYAAGKVTLSDELKAEASGVRTLFVTVFDAESDMPMPYGAMRETLSADPEGAFGSFFLTPERLQVMNPSAPAPTKLRIKVRLDRDGQGGMDQPGDLTGEITGVALGSKDVEILINKKI